MVENGVEWHSKSKPAIDCDDDTTVDCRGKWPMSYHEPIFVNGTRVTCKHWQKETYHRLINSSKDPSGIVDNEANNGETIEETTQFFQWSAVNFPVDEPTNWLRFD